MAIPAGYPRWLRVGSLAADRRAQSTLRIRLLASPLASRCPFAKPKGGTVLEPEEASSPRATTSSGILGEIKSERWARSLRNGGRHRSIDVGFVLFGGHRAGGSTESLDGTGNNVEAI